jgi:hypothetical protein
LAGLWEKIHPKLQVPFRNNPDKRHFRTKRKKHTANPIMAFPNNVSVSNTFKCLGYVLALLSKYCLPVWIAAFAIASIAIRQE